MGGGYISCGEFSGDDKSCSALKGVIDQIVALPSYRPSSELQQCLQRISAFLAGGGDAEWSDCLAIDPSQAAELEPYLEECRRSLISDLGTSDPFKAIEMDDAAPGLDATEAKWGKGKGWRLYCITDLLRAVAHSRVRGDVIYIAFD